MYAVREGMAPTEVLERLDRLENCLSLMLGVPPEQVSPAASPLPANDLYFEFPDDPGGSECNMAERLDRLEDLMARTVDSAALDAEVRDALNGSFAMSR